LLVVPVEIEMVATLLVVVVQEVSEQIGQVHLEIIQVTILS
jgi:hypothetical protein